LELKKNSQITISEEEEEEEETSNDVIDLSKDDTDSGVSTKMLKNNDSLLINPHSNNALLMQMTCKSQQTCLNNNSKIIDQNTQLIDIDTTNLVSHYTTISPYKNNIMIPINNGTIQQQQQQPIMLHKREKYNIQTVEPKYAQVRNISNDANKTCKCYFILTIKNKQTLKLFPPLPDANNCLINNLNGQPPPPLPPTPLLTSRLTSSNPSHTLSHLPCRSNINIKPQLSSSMLQHYSQQNQSSLPRKMLPDQIPLINNKFTTFQQQQQQQQQQNSDNETLIVQSSHQSRGGQLKNDNFTSKLPPVPRRSSRTSSAHHQQQQQQQQQRYINLNNTQQQQQQQQRNIQSNPNYFQKF
jgi:hypothetical protein